MRFTIKAGRHSANRRLRWRILWGNTLRFRFRIVGGWEYDPDRVLNGWSKLFGMASPFVHRNSCRMVWKNTKEGLLAGIYTYINGASPQQKPELKKTLGIVWPNHWYQVVINRHAGGWVISYGLEGYSKDTHFVAHTNRWPLPVHYISHPWIGGRFTLDNDFVVDIERQ